MVDFKKLGDKAAEINNQSETKAGGSFERELPAEGRHLARFIGYIELGKQPQKAWNGKAKPDANKVKLEFELLSPQDIREVEIDGEKRTFTNKQTETLVMSNSEKSHFHKLFLKMRDGRSEINHMVQMLGEAFLVDVVHSEDKKYANILTKDRGWLIQGPYQVDAVTGEKTRINVPEAKTEQRGFIWDIADQEQWDSIFIPGSREVKDKDGSTREVTNNYLQDTICKASNFDGSPVARLLAKSAGGVDTEEFQAPAAPPVEAPEEAPSVEDEAAQKALKDIGLM